MLERWNPFRELRRMEEMNTPWWRIFPGEFEHWHTPVDVLDENDKIVVRANLPGIKPEEVEVTFESGVLRIKGETKEEREEHDENYLMRERKEGKFFRAVRIPDEVDVDKVEPKYENGVLTVTFPKAKAKKARKLEVKVG